MKVSMDMDVAPNTNPPDIQISMDIREFTHYVHHHNNIGAFRRFCNITTIIIWIIEGMGSGGHGRGHFDFQVCLAGFE
jgi:hypothetical protein